MATLQYCFGVSYAIGAFTSFAGSIGAWLADKLLAPALVAVVFSGVTSLLIERHRGRRDAVSKLADNLRDDLRAAQQLAVEYWARGGEKTDNVLEARILAAQTDLLSSFRLLQDLLGAPLSEGAENLQLELLDALTGGDFKSATRGADPDRIIRIAKVIAQLREDVSRARVRNLRKLIDFGHPSVPRNVLGQ